MFFYGFYYVCMFLFYKLFLEPSIHCHCPPLKKNLFVAVKTSVLQPWPWAKTQHSSPSLGIVNNSLAYISFLNYEIIY